MAETKPQNAPIAMAVNSLDSSTGSNEKAYTIGSPTVIVETNDHIATVTLNRPERLNALNGEMADALIQACSGLAKDNAVRCVVLTGAGRGFCAGIDMRDEKADAARRNETASMERMGEISTLRGREEAAMLLFGMPKPTIAMINGPAVGEGLSLALACDLRIAAESARMLVGFLRFGFSGDFGGTWFMQRLLGTAKARELYFLDETVTGKEAERIGLVNRAIPDDQLQWQTMKLARRLAGAPPIAVACMKQNLNLALLLGLPEILDTEAEFQALSRHTEDHLEGVRAFLEKRQPVFRGR